MDEAPRVDLPQDFGHFYNLAGRAKQAISHSWGQISRNETCRVKKVVLLSNKIELSS